MIFSDMKECLRNKNFVLLILAFNFIHGIFLSLGSSISYLTKPFFESKFNSLFATTFSVCGVIASIFVAIKIDKSKKYKLYLMILTGTTNIFLALIYVTMVTVSTAGLAIDIAFVGMTAVPIIPVGLAFAVELTFPITEAASNGILMMIS